MALFRRCTSATEKGYSWIAIFALYIIITIKPTKQMAEQQVFCNGTFFYRNNHDAFVRVVKAMRNCTILEGGLHITFLNLTRTTEILENNALFPNLREISGFLLLHDIDGFETVAELFPKLSVIRGETPLKNGDFQTALCISDNKNLKRIGLDIAVLNSSVHIRGNKKLCPSELDAWKRFSPEVKIDIRNNMADGIKTSKDNAWWCRGNYSARPWPSPPSITCHKQCLGGCSGGSPKECYVCRSFQHNDTCIQECPPEKSIHLPSHRCTDELGCQQLGYINIFPNLKEYEKSARFLVRNNACTPGCEEPYEPRFDYGFMKCKKLCSPGKITTVSELEEYQNCTYTGGHLEIAPVAECEKFNVAEWENALKRNLGAIKTINGSLVLRRLHGIQNLHFLKSLDTIVVTNRNYSIFIDDNGALNQLFTEYVTNKLKIRSEKAYYVTISNNPMLCSKEISRLKRIFSNDGKPINSNNGGRAKCNASQNDTRPEELTVYKINATDAVIEWNPEALLPVVYSTLYFRLVPPNDKVSVLAMNFPTSESWESLDRIQNFTANMTFALTKLNAGSRYAVYIESIGDKEKGVDKATVLRSNITYFWTESLRSRPCTVSAWPYPTVLSSESALKIEWAGPTRTPIETAIEYMITGEYLKETRSPCSSPNFRQLNFLDYCTVLKQRKPEEDPISDRRQVIEPCYPNEFSSYLDSFLEKSQSHSSKPHYAFPMDGPRPLPKIVTKNETDNGNSTGRLVYFAVVSSSEAVVVENLVPFGNYQIKVYTCSKLQDSSQNISWDIRCSSPNVAFGRSSAIENADTLVLSPFTIPSNHSSSFVLQWGKGKVTNSLAWYTVNVMNERNMQETLCSEDDEMKFENKPDGLYKICVTVESMFKSGETRCISYSVAVSHPWVNFLFVSFGLIGLIIAVGFVVRRIQQFQSEDRVILLSAEAFDTDVRFSEIPVNDLETVLL